MDVTTMAKVDMKQACYYNDKGRPEMDLAATMAERQEMDCVTTMPKVDKKWILDLIARMTDKDRNWIL